MNSRQNLHQRCKFLRSEASRDVLKLRVSEMAFRGVSRGIFHHGCQVAESEYMQDWEQCCRNPDLVKQ